jgi:hypothetical protein
MIPLVVQVELIDQHKATTHAFVHSPVRIGRNSLNDVVLNLPYVSQWHSVVRIDEDKSYYIDLGATNPTVVDGKPLAKHEEVAVDENVDVRIGNIRFHFLRAPAPPELIRPYQRDSAFSLPTPGSFRLADSEAVSDGRSNRPPPRVQAQPPLPAMSPAASTPPAAPAMPPLVAHQPQPAAAFSEPPPPSVRPPAGVVSVTAATAIKSRRPSALPSSMPAGPTDLPRLNQAGAALSPGFGPPRVEPGLYPPQARATGADPVFA